jgi:orotate phosphoribosyltransferase
MLPENLIAELYRFGCILVGEFRLSSGKTSPYYIDLRKIPSNPKLFDEITDVYIRIIRGLGEVDRIAGIATASIPIATLIAYKLRKPLIYVRRERREHGTASGVEGELNLEDRVIVVDDVATTGESIRQAVRAVREKGGIVRHSVVLIDREQGAGRLLAEDGVVLTSATTARSLFEHLRLKGLVSEEDYGRIMRYLEGGDV